LKLNNYIDGNLIFLLQENKKREVLLQMINSICENKRLNNKERVNEAIFYRESLMSTGIGLGIAVPHVRIKGIKEPIVAVGIQKDGIPDYETIDNIPVKIVFLIIAGEDQHKEYIQILSLVVTKLKQSEVRERLIEAKSKEELYQILIS
jgi:mannitol/fructose-specific phosphotransferase system IIA component (Ntr-type)